MVQVLKTAPTGGFDTLTAALSALRVNTERGIFVIRSSKEEEFVSYADLYSNACYTLANLRSYGIRPGDELMIQVDDSKEFLVLFWACLLGGIIAVPLSTGVQEQQKSKVLNVTATLHNPYWVGSDESLERIQKIPHTGDATAQTLAAYIKGHAVRLNDVFVAHTAAEPVLVTADQTAYIQFSSGSTGTPKGVVLTHGNLIANTSSIIERTCISPNDTMLSWMPLTHDMGLICFHLSGLVAGVNQHIMPTALFIRTPLLWLEKASEHQANYLYSPNFGLQYVLSAFEGYSPTWDLSAVKSIYNGAEPISADLCELFMRTMQPYGMGMDVMFPGYGLAEASVAVTLPNPGERVVSHVVSRRSLQIGNPVTLLPDATDADALTLVEVGFPIPRTEVRIADDTDTVLPDGSVGHIQIRGENVTYGYYNNPEASRNAFSADGWLRTGDLGYSQKGRLTVTGRLKELIIVNGQNYYPHDIERVAQKVPGIDLGKVVATSHWNAQVNKEDVLLFVLFKKQPEQFVPLAKALRTILLQEIGITVDKVLPCRRIAKTTSGKIQRFQFIEGYQQGEFDAAWQVIDAQLEADTRAELAHLSVADQVRVCWQNSMGTPFAEAGSVYELGITSLQITRFIARLNQAAGTQFTVRDVFECDTLGDFIQRCESRPARASAIIMPTAPQPYYPVTDAQRRLWFTDQFTSGTSAYNIAVGYTLEGLLDETILDTALQQVVARHEVLRTAFDDIDGIVRQRVLTPEALAFKLTFVDATTQTEKQVEAFIQAEANYRFDLRRGGLFRATLIRQPSPAYTLLLVIHHSVSDGWSVGLLMQEITERYRRLLANDPLEQPAPGIHYKDYAAWLATQPYPSNSLAFWKNQLEPAHPVLDFPTYGMRSPIRSKKAGTVTYALDLSSLSAVHKLARQHQATVFMVLLAMVKATLYRNTGQTDMVLGTDVANRQLGQLTDQPGYFLNTLCVRTSFDARDSLSNLIANVKQQLLACLAHQDVPFETLLDQLDVPRDQSRSPLFDALVIFQNFDPVPFTPTADIRQTGYLNPAIDETIVDLHFELTERSGELSIQLRYNSDVYQPGQMQQMCRHLEETIIQCHQDASQPLWQYPLASVPVAPPALTALPTTTLLQAMSESMATHRELVAIQDETANWTYGQVWDKANAIAHELIQNGLQPEECVGLLMPRSAGAVAALLGVLKAGGAYVPLDVDYPSERLRYLATDADLRVIIVPEAGLSISHGLADYPELVVTSDWSPTPYPAINVARQGHDLAYVLYTSGTTGLPKGVEITHASLADYVQTFTEYFQIEANDSVVQQSSLSFDTSVEEIFPVLLRGGSVRIVRGGGKDIAGLIRAINEGATVLSTTPLVMNELNREAHKLAGHLRLLISGGDVLRYEQVNELVRQCRVVNTYGPTESTVCVCYEEVKTGEPAILIGQPIAGRTVVIIGADGQQQPVGVFGELWIGGTGLARGYRHNPALTRQQFIHRPEGRFYRSGDWVRQLPDGRLEFAGRRDNQLKIRGYRVELDEVEQVIGQCVGVDSVAVLAREDGATKQLIAFYTGSRTESNLRTSIAERLPHYMVPASLKRLDTLPRTVNGKVDKTALLQLTPTATPTHDRRGQTSLEKTIAEVWTDILGVSPIQLTDNFFELGGHSIKGVRATQWLAQRLNLSIDLSDLFQHPTLETFGACLARKSRATYAAIRPVPPQASYSVSSAQRSMWLLQQLNPDSPAYSVSFAVELTGNLKTLAFEQAWHEVVARHESLRTVFREEPDGIRQVVLAPQEVGFSVQWTELTSPTDADIQRQLQAWAAVPFDLAKAPLLRINVLSVAPNRYILSVIMHHIVGDDWSAGVLLRDVFSNYSQLADGYPIDAEPLAIQYKEYAAWQQQQVATDQMLAHRRFWQTQLADELPVLQLPQDGDRPAMKDFAGDSTAITLGPDLTKAVQQLAQANGLTEYMVWLSALNLLLMHYTGQRDLVVGCPVAGRDHIDLEPQIGCYVNTLPLRLKLQDSWSIDDLLQRVRQTTLAAFEHQAYPFADLVRELAIQRDLSRSPLFDVLLTLQNATDATEMPRMRNLTATPYSTTAESCKFDWDIDIRPLGNERRITVAFDKNLYSRNRMDRMLGHLVAILDLICQDSTQPVTTLTYLANAEKQQLLGWSEGNLYRCNSEQTIVDSVKNAVATFADRTAIEDHTDRWTYREVWAWSNRLANQLTELDIQPEDRVGICLPRSVWTAAALLGILKAGGAYVPMDMTYPADRLNYMVADAGIRLVLVPESGTLARMGIQSVQEVVVEQTALSQFSAADPSVTLSAKQLAYVLYTSGSTGTPKGVAIEHRNTVAFLLWCRDEFANADFDQALAVTSLNFDLSVFEFLYPLLVGKAVRVLDSGLSLPDYLSKASSARLMVNTVPSVVEMLLRTQADLRNITVLNMAGEPIGHYVRQRLNYAQMQVRNLYGPTEDTTYSTCFRLTSPDAAGKIGKPKYYSQAYVLGIGNQLQPIGVAGEICLSGAGLARGYHNRPELTAARFIPHPLRPGDRLYCTGDWGYWDEDGQLVCTGRIDNQVKLRGYRLELSEIEKKIESAGAELAVAVIVGEGMEQRLVAFYQAADLAIDDLTTQLQAFLPAWMVPQQLIPVTAFPQNLNGKIDRRQLLAMLPALDAPDTLPTDTETWSDTESRMKPLWESELGVANIGRTDNFFQLGGHSLTATQLVARIRRDWQQQVPLKAIFLYPTIAQLSQAMHQFEPSTELLPPAKRAADGRYPLSAAQERVWLAHQVEGTGHSYHMPFCATLTGLLDGPAFQEAWATLVARHEILRTVFVAGDPELYQQVLDPAQTGFVCSVYDCQSAADPELASAAEREAMVDEPFDLEAGPLLRIGVWQTGPTTYQLGVVFHHLICDGWSLGVIIRELFDTYNTRCQGLEPDKTPLAIQYCDYTAWEEKHRQTVAWRDSRQYWSLQLGGSLPVLALPTAPRRLARKAKAGDVQRTLNRALTSQLEALARQQNVSLYSLLLAGLNTLLYRYTNQTDLIVGCAAAGREQAHWHEQVGLYVNTLALRSQFSGTDRFDALLSNVHQTVTNGYVHQAFSFDALVESLSLPRDASRSPLFDVMFTLQQAKWDVTAQPHQLTGLQLTNATEPATTPKYDLDITVSAAHPDRTVRVRYDQGLFTTDQIEQLLQHYETILTAVLADPQRSLQAIGYLTTAEQQQLLAWGNPWTAPTSTETITSLFARQVAQSPAATAVQDETGTWTYAELDTWSDRVAGYLDAEYGVATGEKIGLLMSRSAWSIVGILGILKAGGAYVPIDSTHPRNRISYILEDSAVRLVLTDKALWPTAIDVCMGEVVDIQLVPTTVSPRFNQATPDQLAYVMYTSGSTGNPKGVLVEHQGVVRLVRQPDYITFSPTDRLLMTGAMSFDATTFEIWGMLLNGGQLCLVSNDTLLDPALLKQALHRWRISMMWMTAAWFDQVVDADPLLFAGLEWLLVGGDTLSPAHIALVKTHFPSLKLINGYGPTENTTFSLCHRIEVVEAGSIPIGRPIAQSSVYLLDPYGQLVPIGVEGELYLGGTGLARGYQNQPRLTAEKFMANPFVTGQRLYKTGDLGMWLPDGTVAYRGRSDNQVKIRGYRLETGEIENALMGYPTVRQAVVLVESTSADKRLVAYYVSESRLDDNDLRLALQRVLPVHAIPDRFVWLARMPLTPNGKTDRDALRQVPSEQTTVSTIASAPATALEQTLLAIWQGVLSREPITLDDNFFDVGGHSLRATKLVTQLRKQLGISVPVSKIFQHPTVRSLAREIGSMMPQLPLPDQADQIIEEIIL